MRVLITGGAGFIGSNLVKKLQADGIDDIRVLDDLSTGNLANLEGTDVDFRQASILDVQALRDAADGCDSIVHLAAFISVPESVESPITCNDVNVNGSLNVLEVAREVGSHVTLASSSAVYGSSDVLPKTEAMKAEPVSPYAVSKLAMEAYGLSYSESYGMDVVPYRFFNVFGPGQGADHGYAAVVPAFVSRALAGEPLKIFGDGLQTRDFIYVESVADVLSRTARNQLKVTDVVNLALGQRSTVLDLVAELEGVLGVELETEFLPPRAGDVRDSQADTTRVSELFDDLAPVSLRDGLKATVDWFRQQAKR